MDILITKDSIDASDKIIHGLPPALFKSSDSNCKVSEYSIYLFEEAISKMEDPVL